MFGFANLVQRHLVAGPVRIAFRLVRGRLDDGVGQRNIIAAQKLLIIDEVLATFLIAIGAPFIGTSGKARIGHIHVVGRAAHDADRVFGIELQPLVALHEVRPGARDHVADVDLLARFGVRHQAVVGVLVLQVECGGKTARCACKGGMVGDVGNLFVADPDFAAIGQTFEKLLPCACRHVVYPPLWPALHPARFRRCAGPLRSFIMIHLNYDCTQFIDKAKSVKPRQQVLWTCEDLRMTLGP